MTHILIGSFLSAAMLFSAAAAAQQHTFKSRPTYTYAGVKYLTETLDDFDCDQDGLLVDGSYDVNGAIFARAALADVSGDNCGSTAVRAGLGYRAAWGASSHIYLTTSFIDISVDAGEDDSGFAFGGGMRGYVLPNLETYGEIEYQALDDGELRLNAGAALWLTGQFSVTGDIGFSADIQSFAIGGRMAF